MKNFKDYIILKANKQISESKISKEILKYAKDELRRVWDTLTQEIHGDYDFEEKLSSNGEYAILSFYTNWEEEEKNYFEPVDEITTLVTFDISNIDENDPNVVDIHSPDFLKGGELVIHADFSGQFKGYKDLNKVKSELELRSPLSDYTNTGKDWERVCKEFENFIDDNVEEKPNDSW